MLSNPSLMVTKPFIVDDVCAVLNSKARGGGSVTTRSSQKTDCDHSVYVSAHLPKSQLSSQ